MGHSALLTTLRDECWALHAATESLGDDPSQSDIDTVLDEREKVLGQVNATVRQLDSQDVNWRRIAQNDEHDRSVFGDIEETITRAARLDQCLAGVLEKRMAQINSQLQTATNHSRAAVHYLSHKRR